MTPTTYFIIGGIALVFIVYFVILQRMANQRKKSDQEPFKSLAALTPKQERALAFGAILFVMRDEQVLTLIPNQKLDIYRYGLQNQWEIIDSESARESLEDLIQLYRSRSLDAHLQERSDDLVKLQKQVASALGQPLALVESVKSSYAWDIGRAISLARWCFWTGYLTEAEMWDYIHQAVEIAEENGQDWPDYAISFLLGRTLQGFDPDDVSGEIHWLLSQKVFDRKDKGYHVFHTQSFKG